ncbi:MULTISPECIES: sensor histidine kinase [Sphingobacterium]|uniref:histidine kinase n=1 Tax=Sphingobacterium populi TaxID=1812824 RepID=A0ABW5UDP1_9SPHI|nr:ATP-binding protein [Sphingobacterium sp. CFCC 11742]
MGNRVLLLLSIIMFLLFATALIIHNTITEADMLSINTETISSNIHKKEKVVEDLFTDSLALKTFANVERYPTQALQLTKNLSSDDQLTYFYVYKNNKPIFWSSNLLVPPSDKTFVQETTFVDGEPRSYIVKKKKIDSEMSVIAVILIRRAFNHSNSYLSNRFYKNIIPSDNLEIARYSDDDIVRNVYSRSGTYLFSVKFKQGKYHNVYLTMQLLAWVLGSIILLSIINRGCFMLAKKGYAWSSILAMIAVLAIIKWISLHADWLSATSSMELFNPRYYAYNPLLPNLWEFIVTTVSATWLIFYIRSIQIFLAAQNPFNRNIQGIILSGIVLSSIYLLSNLLLEHLSTLITHTPSVNMDFTNILGFSTYSWVNVTLFCVNIVLLLLYIDFAIGQVRTMLQNMTIEINMQLITLILFLLISALFFEQAVYYNLLVGIVLLVRSYTRHKNTQHSFFNIVIVLLSISLLSSFIYHKSIRAVKQKQMDLTLKYLEAENDMNAISIFAEMEKNFNADSVLIREMLTDAELNKQPKMLNNYIKTKYLEGYLSRYEHQFYYYIDDVAIENYGNDKMAEYREKVINQAVRVPNTDHFYRVRSELGTHEYFFQIDVAIDDTRTGQIFVNLRNYAYSPSLPYPEFLVDSKVDIIREHYASDAAFALYKDRILLTQNGNYVYPAQDTEFPMDLNKTIELPDDKGFYHMLFRPDVHTTIIVSKPKFDIWQSLAIVSFLFISLFIVYLLALMIQYLTTVIFQRSFTWRTLQYQFILLQNKFRYSTRIQTIVICTVILAIFISGTIAFFTIRKQLETSNLALQESYSKEVSHKLENLLSNSEKKAWNDDALQRIREINEFSNLDANIYDKRGILIYSSQPRIFETRLVSQYINPDAYNELNVIKKTNVTLTERIGDFDFNSSYSTIKNEDSSSAAFVNIPNYAAKKEEIRNSNLLLNSLLNIYTVIILIAGFIAVWVSRLITKPLLMIGEKMVETTISGKDNEPLYWERDDEIGALVKAYNLMLVKMEHNTKQLMNAEREYAWREMARQVAHEIKNPLTPMKLGIQQLMRSFNENDPRFEDRFKKFSDSFIEQIDSLSKIAVEFSNFAKLPNTELVTIDLLDKIREVVTFFNSSLNTNILIANKTGRDKLFVLSDKDQILRSFNNLIKNAIEASRGRRKNTIKITMSLVEEGMLQIDIADKGLGIAAEVIPKIFQPNFTTKSSGTGLGLAFVKKTVESMQGQITFTTAENLGTTFTLILPMTDAPANT